MTTELPCSAAYSGASLARQLLETWKLSIRLLEGVPGKGLGHGINAKVQDNKTVTALHCAAWPRLIMGPLVQGCVSYIYAS